MNGVNNTRTQPSPAEDFYLTDSLLTDEERAVRDRVRGFAEHRLRPVAAAGLGVGDLSGSAPARVRRARCPRGYGEGLWLRGAEQRCLWARVARSSSRVDSSFATFVNVQAGLRMTAIATCGWKNSKRAGCRVWRVEAIGAFALTEPEHGSDASRLETRASRDGNDYVLDGRKRWIANATLCDVAVVWARAEDGIAGFLVEPSTPGWTATAIDGKLALRGIAQADIRLESCRVPAANRLSQGGFRAVTEILSRSRHYVSWHALGEAIACYEAALAHAFRRQQFGQPLAAFQLVQAKLVRMLGEITKAQLLVIQLGRLLDRAAGRAG